MASYSAAKMVIPNKDTAYVQCFFTQKNKALYCIVPSYQQQLKLNNTRLSAGMVVSVLGTSKKITAKQMGKDVIIDLSALRPGDVSASGVFVIKLAKAIQ